MKQDPFEQNFTSKQKEIIEDHHRMFMKQIRESNRLNYRKVVFSFVTVLYLIAGVQMGNVYFFVFQTYRNIIQKFSVEKIVFAKNSSFITTELLVL